MHRTDDSRAPAIRRRYPPLFLWLLLALNAATLPAQETPSASAAPPARYSGAQATDYPSWFKQSFLALEEDVAEAASRGKRLMLLFHQQNCPYCNALVRYNLSQKDIAEQMQTQLDVVAINLWGDLEVISVAGVRYTEKTFAQALKVQYTPTLLFFNEQGKIMLRLNGYLPPQEFRLALRYVTDKRETMQSYRDYVEAHLPAAAAAGALHQAAFFTPPPYDLSYRGEAWARPLAVFFEQRQCPNCTIFHRQVLTDSALLDLLERFTVVQLDMWSDAPVVTPGGQRLTARDWAQQLGVSYAPTIVLFSRRGQEIIRSEAYFKIFHTQSVFDYVLSGSYSAEPSFQRYLSSRAERLLGQGIDVDIWR